MEYDEKDSIKFIRTTTGDLLSSYDDDQIINIIDIVWDWQDENGFLDIDPENPDDEIDIDKLTSHALKLLSRDKGNLIAPEHVAPIIKAELKFEDTL